MTTSTHCALPRPHAVGGAARYGGGGAVGRGGCNVAELSVQCVHVSRL
eukprot:gene27077-2000_t